jgi:hypothetical protein
MSTPPFHTLDSLLSENCNVGNPDRPIYRVFSMHWFKDMIANKAMGLVRPSMWDDPFENFLLQCKVRLPDGIASLAGLRERWYGQCWTSDPNSDAIWRIYSPKLDGVLVKTTARKLFTAFCDPDDDFAQLKFFLAKVQYMSKRRIEKFLEEATFRSLAWGGQNNKFAQTLLVKRPEFKHEKEVRLLFCDAEKTLTGDVYVIPFQYDAVLSDATLDPRLTKTQFKRRKKVLEKMGCSIPIKQSNLYKIKDELVIRSE